MSEQDVVEALKFGKELPHLKEQFLLLVEQIDSLEYKKNNSKAVESAQYKSIYWRSSHPIHLFVDALESNLKKKYKQFTDSQISTQRILIHIQRTGIH